MRKKAIIFLFLFLLLVVCVFSQTSFWYDYIVAPYVAGKKPLVIEREVHPGVMHKTEFRPEGPLLINVVEIELSRSEIGIETEKGGLFLFGGERVSQMAERENKPGHFVIAGINADFWRAGYIPIGPFVDRGMIFKSHNIRVPRAVFMLDDRKVPYIGVFKMDMVVEVNENLTCPIDFINVDDERINLPDEEKDLILFTPAFGSSTLTETGGRTEVVLENLSHGELIPNKTCIARVISVNKESSNTSFSGNQLVLSATGRAKRFLEKHLRPGMEIRIKICVPGVERPIVYMVGGGPLLIQDGGIKIDNKEEAIRDSFVKDRHPRTAIGITKDRKKVFFFTVDGRQPGLSIGMSLYQVAKYLKDMGAYEAMNLDGGGSTTMWVRGELVNRPSDRTGERKVTNALLLVSRTMPGPPQYIEVYPWEINIPPGASTRLFVFVEDEFRNRLSLSNKEVEISAKSEIGFAREGMIFVAAKHTTRGKIVVKLRNYPDVSAEVPVKIENVAQVKVEPAIAVMRKGDEIELKVKLLDSLGQELLFRPSDLKLCLPVFISSYPENPLRIRAKTKGAGVISFEIAGKREEVPVFVDVYEEELIFNFDSILLTGKSRKRCLSGSFYDTVRTRLLLEKKEKREGRFAYRLEYLMLKGGISIISVPVHSVIQKEPAEINLWVYGGGKEEWLRAKLVDRDGETFLVDFTGSTGICWTGWRLLRVKKSDIFPDWTNPGAKVDYPVVVECIYIAQGQEKLKSSGVIILDALSAVYPPSGN